MELYSRFSPRIYGYLQSRIADSTKVDEIFQNVFLKIHKSRTSYKSEYAFAPWLFVVARSAMNDYFRVNGKKEAFEVLNEQEVSQAPSHQGSGLSNEGEEFEALIKNLPEREQEVLRQRYKDDFEFEEIAKNMKTSSSNVRQMISRATRKLGGNI